MAKRMLPATVMASAIIITTNMTEDTGLIRLMSWFSPAMPTGGFAYSGGLEAAVRDRRVSTAAQLQDWIVVGLSHGTAWNDAVLFGEAWRCGTEGQVARLGEIAELAGALAGSQTRLDETLSLGRSFLHAVAQWPETSEAAALAEREIPYPVAVGWFCGKAEIAPASSVAAFLHGFCSAQLQAAIRLGAIGQVEAARLLAQLEPAIAAAAERASAATLDDLGGCAMLAEIAAMRHETLESRLFRS